MNVWGPVIYVRCAQATNTSAVAVARKTKMRPWDLDVVTTSMVFKQQLDDPTIVSIR